MLFYVTVNILDMVRRYLKQNFRRLDSVSRPVHTGPPTDRIH
jgi:hypothetical protein